MNTTSVSLLERLRQPTAQQAWQRFVDLYTPLLYYWACRHRQCRLPDQGPSAAPGVGGYAGVRRTSWSPCPLPRCRRFP